MAVGFVVFVVCLFCFFLCFWSLVLRSVPFGILHFVFSIVGARFPLPVFFYVFLLDSPFWDCMGFVGLVLVVFCAPYIGWFSVLFGNVRVALVALGFSWMLGLVIGFVFYSCHGSITFWGCVYCSSREVRRIALMLSFLYALEGFMCVAFWALVLLVLCVWVCWYLIYWLLCGLFVFLVFGCVKLVCCVVLFGGLCFLRACVLDFFLVKWCGSVWCCSF